MSRVRKGVAKRQGVGLGSFLASDISGDGADVSVSCDCSTALPNTTIRLMTDFPSGAPLQIQSWPGTALDAEPVNGANNAGLFWLELRDASGELLAFTARGPS